MHLNEFGLWRWQSNGSRETQEDAEEKGFWEFVRADTEEDVLTELGMEYVDPTKRSFSFLVNKPMKNESSKAKKR